MRQDSHEPTPVLDLGTDADRPPAARRVADVPEGERYELGEEVARGGLGRVLRARDRRLARVVAIKESLQGGARQGERFQREALITARLQHPSIVPVYDAGVREDGEPFYSMKLVAGESLEAAFARADGFAGRMALLPGVIAVADAIAYAHSERVVHRDLKPANVLVGNYGETLVIDWGMARELDGADIAPAGAVVGTPAYMPPEQAAGEPADERSDVYALGAILHHLLTGAAPGRGAGLPAEAPADLVAIVKRAMADRREDRYASAGELAEDLRRFQTGRLVSAHAYSSGELVLRWLRRHRAAVLVASVLLAALAVTGVVSVGKIVRARELADARRVQVEERSNTQKLLQARAVLDADPTATLAWLKSWSPRPADLPRALQVAADARSRGVASAIHRCPGRSPWPYDGIIVGGHGFVETCEDGVHFWGAREQVLHPPGGMAHDLESPPDGRWLASHDLAGGAVVIWRWQGERLEPTPLPEKSAGMVALANGTLVTVGADGAISRWAIDDAGARKLGTEAAGGLALVAAAGDTLLMMDGGSALVAWEGKRPLGRAVLYGLSQDGRWLAGIDEEGKLSLRSVGGDGGGDVALGATSGVLALAASPHGARVALADQDHVITVVERDGTRRVLGRLASTQPILAWEASEKRLAVGAGDGELVLFDLDSGRTLPLRGHARLVRQLLWAADAPVLMSLSEDTELRAWSLDLDRGRRLGGATPFALAWAPDGSRVAAAGNDGVVRVWEVATGAAQELRAYARDASSLAWSPDGTQLASGGEDESARLWRISDGTSRMLGEPVRGTAIVAFAPDGARVAVGGGDGRIILYEVASGAAAMTLAGHSGEISWLAFGPGGRELVSASSDGTAMVWEVATGAVRRRLEGHGGQVLRAAFSPDGARVATTCADGTVRLWQLDRAGEPLLLARLDASAFDVVWAPAGDRLAYSGWEGTVGVFTPASGETRTFLGHSGRVYELAFTPDGRFLASAGADQSVRVWEVASGAAHVLRLQDGAVRRVAFSPDGAILASGDQNGGVRLWTTALRGIPPSDARGFAAWLGEATRVVIGPDDRATTPGSDNSDAPERVLRR